MMALVNQAAMEALCAATYLENYLDCMDNLPDDLQRVVSELRELDSAANEIINDIAANQALYTKEEDIHKKKKALAQVHRYLIKSQEIGDEKLRLVATMSEFIENRTRQLEQDLENLGISKKPRLDPTLGEGKEEKEKKSELRLPKPIAAAMRLPSPVQPSPPLSVQSTPTVNNAMNIITQQTNHGKSSSMSTVVTPPAAASSIAAESKQDTPVSSAKQNKRQRRQRNAEISKQEEEKQKEEEEKMQPKKKKKRKAKKTGDKSFEKTLIGEPIDPDEPTYCLCGQVSYGDMIGCDNDNCAIEWFHFNCVGLHSKPKGKWYCPKCRGDKPNIKRSDLK